MVASTLDTLRFSQTLMAAGVSKEQAEAHATVLADVLKVNFQELVTKDQLRAELRDVQHQLDAKIDGVEQRLNAKIDSAEQRLDAKIDLAVAKLTGEMILLKWMMGVNTTLMVAILVRLFFFALASP